MKTCWKVARFEGLNVESMNHWQTDDEEFQGLGLRHPVGGSTYPDVSTIFLETW
jgi:hypothetical protein